MGDREFPAPFGIGIGPRDLTFRGVMYILHFSFERVNPTNFGGFVLPSQSSTKWFSFATFQPFAICIQYGIV